MKLVEIDGQTFNAEAIDLIASDLSVPGSRVTLRSGVELTFVYNPSDFIAILQSKLTP